MCGIAGVLDWRGQTDGPLLVNRMLTTLAHRGPDGRGVVGGDTCALGACRLAIVDRAHGGQPIQTRDGRFTLVFNGEVYNHLALRRELEQGGTQLQTDCDTEVLLHVFASNGLACLRWLDWIGAFAIYDALRQRLVLARDRFGAKPLYLARLPTGSLAFASEVKALLAAGLKAEIDPLGLAEQMTFQNQIGGRTLFAGVRLLEPGCVMLIDQDRTTTARYWGADYSAATGTDETLVDNLRQTLVEAVNVQAPREVRGVVYLSGGLDTPALAAMARRHPSVWPDLASITVGFDHDDDERQQARELAEWLDADHVVTSVTPERFAELLPRVIWHLDEPRVGASVQVYVAAQLAKAAGATVVLSGTGADEIFGGYPWRYQRAMGLADSAEFERAYFAEWCRVTSPETHSHLFSQAILRELPDSYLSGRVTAIMESSRDWDPLHRALAFDTQTFLHGLLVVEDKLSMAHGVEVRVPYLSNAVVNLAQRMGPALKVSADDCKIVLRRAMRGYLPDDILDRPKVGFAPPLAEWFRGPLAGYASDLLLTDRCLERGWFSRATVLHAVETHVSGDLDNSKLLYSLLAVELWARLFLDGEPLAESGAIRETVAQSR